MRAAIAAIGRTWLAAVACVVLLANAYAAALYFWRLYPDDQSAQAFWVSVSVVASSVKIILPAIVAADGRRFTKPLALAWLIAVAFDLFAAYSFSQQTTGAVTAGASELAAARKTIEGGISERQRKVSAVPEARQPVVIRTALAVAETMHGKCAKQWEAKTDGCQTVFKLRNELAEAETRDKLLDEIVALRESLARLPAERDPDPQITAIRSAFAALNHPVSVEAASRIKSIFLLLLLELVPVAVLAYVLRPVPKPLKAEKPAKGAKPARPAGAPAAPATRPLRAAGAQDVLALLAGAAADADGWISLPPQRTLAATLGISPAEVNRQITALVADGTIEKQAGRSGTRVKFKAMPQNVQPLRRTA